uniref:Retrovirus-related Pol polyprotein from transposon TNT 1-94 n=1 Tax=Tanacetum cinerariifolium TaxID=118510 RepID=A0A6L2JNK8_TANCI|nr:retrovirus-related Pol polyprotein from transposon TNT 1-94 [Tanacetum cinerariifolium]
MDSDATHMIAASKVPMLKPREFKLWRVRIEQYIQMIDYALYDIIKNRNSIPKTQTVNNIETVIPPTTGIEKLQRKNEVKRKSTLMMGLPNEHQLKFNSFKDAKSLLAAIEKRSLPFEWGMHVVVWRNKPDLDTLNMDDLYNNLMVYEPEVKRISSSTNTQNIAFVSSSLNNSNSSNGFNTAQRVHTANGVNTASSQVNAASSLNTDILSDAVICAFLASQPNCTHFVNEDLEQIHHDDLEEMDLKAPRGHDNMSRDVTRKTMPVETPNSSAIVPCDGQGGYDWSDQAEEGPTNYALMAYSTPSASSSDSEQPLLPQPASPQSTATTAAVTLIPVTSTADTTNCYHLTTATTEHHTTTPSQQPSPSSPDATHRHRVHLYLLCLSNICILPIVLHHQGDYAYACLDGKPFGSFVNSDFNTLNVTSCKTSLLRGVTQPKQNTHRKREAQSKLTTLKNSYANKKVKTIWVKKVNTAKTTATINAAKEKAKHNVVKGKRGNVVKASTCWGNPHEHLQDKGVIDSGCSRHMIGNMSFLTDYKEIDGGYVVFEGNPKGWKITSKGKFDGKADEGFFVGYSLNSKTFRVFNSRTRIVEENIHVKFSENTLNHVDNEFQPLNNGAKRVDEDLSKENECNDKGVEDSTNSTNKVNTITSNINVTSSSRVNVVITNISIDLPPDPNMPSLEDIGIFKDSHDDEDVFSAEADFHNLDSTFQFSPILTTRIHKDHPLKQVIGDLHSAPQTRRMSKNLEEHGLHTQEDGIDYDEVFAPVAKIKAIRLFLAYASFKDFIVYQMEVKSAFLYGKIKEEVYVCQPPGCEDPEFLDKVYKVEKALYGLHQAPRACYETLFTYLLDNRFKRRQIDKTLFIKRNKGDILLVQVYVDDIIFGSTKMEMYIMFAVCACAIYQVTPKVSHLHDVKRIFRYLKGQPKLGLWYPKDSPFDLVAYTISDYVGETLDRKFTTGGCQFLGCRLILGSVKSRMWLQTPQLRLSTLLLQVAVVKVNAAIDAVKVSAVKYN